MKICSHCNQELPLESFSWKIKAKGTRQSVCKVCQRQAKREEYYKDPQKHIDRLREGKKRQRVDQRNFISAYLTTHPCVDCGESDIEVLEFDHIEMVGGRGSRVCGMTCGRSRLLEEIAKCEVRCANCHRRRTRRQLGRLRCPD